MLTNEQHNKDVFIRFLHKNTHFNQETMWNCCDNSDVQNSNFSIQALTLIRDMPALYTNRAQAYIKLGEYQKAIDDCEWALRVSIRHLFDNWLTYLII